VLEYSRKAKPKASSAKHVMLPTSLINWLCLERRRLQVHRPSHWRKTHRKIITRPPMSTLVFSSLVCKMRKKSGSVFCSGREDWVW
jgi:hypothetical protein